MPTILLRPKTTAVEPDTFFFHFLFLTPFFILFCIIALYKTLTPVFSMSLMQPLGVQGRKPDFKSPGNVFSMLMLDLWFYSKKIWIKNVEIFIWGAIEPKAPHQQLSFPVLHLPCSASSEKVCVIKVLHHVSCQLVNQFVTNLLIAKCFWPVATRPWFVVQRPSTSWYH